jgi:basic membrane protein A
MKKFLALLLAAIMVVGLLGACGGSGSSTPASTPASTDGGDGGSEDAGVPNILFFYSAIGDYGFGDQGYKAVQNVKDTYGWKDWLIEYGTDTSVAVTSLWDSVEVGVPETGEPYDYVVTTSWNGLYDTIVEQSANYPDTKFIVFDTGPDKVFDNANVYGISFAQNEGSFLTAVFEAYQSETGVISTIARSDSPILNDFCTGWIHGAKYANKDLGLGTKYLFTYLGETSSSGCLETCSELFANTSQGAKTDIMYLIASDYILSATQSAFDNGVKWVIGVDTDQWQALHDQGIDDSSSHYNLIVTSMQKKIEESVAWTVAGILDGSLAGGNHAATIANGGVGIADQNENFKAQVSAETQAAVKAVADSIASGGLDIHSYYDFTGDDFYEKYVEYYTDHEKSFEEING